MRPPIRRLEITSTERSFSEMELAGVDPVGARLMAPKHFHYNLKLTGLTPPQANIIKQEILSLGGEAAVSKGTVACRIEQTDAVLSGTEKQLLRLVEKLSVQPYSLFSVADDIKAALDVVCPGSGNLGLMLKGRGRVFTTGERTLVMGILNVTPDSFSGGGGFAGADGAIEAAMEMAAIGADIIDVGGESTRPGSEPVSEDEELSRVAPVVEALVKQGLCVSVDTQKSVVARAALELGAWMINDVSALSFDPAMAGVVKEFDAALALMHMRGTPATMQDDTQYSDLIGEIFSSLHQGLVRAEEAGIARENIVVDPGIGFGKSGEGNLEIINRLREFTSLGRPILVGTSRKGFIGEILGGVPVGERLSGTLATVTASILAGAGIVRVHDVREAREAADVADAIKGVSHGV